MADQVVDTNVLIVASAAEGVASGYPAAGVSVGSAEIEKVFDWLKDFRDDPTRKLVLDELFEIYQEYHNKLSGQHFGLQVIDFKLRECLRQVPVAYDGNGHGIVPSALSPVDNSDKKFVAAALHDPSAIHIVNATDSDWKQQQHLLQQFGITVIELL